MALNAKIAICPIYNGTLKLSLIKYKTDIDVYNFEIHYFQLLLLYKNENYTFFTLNCKETLCV